MLKAKKYQLLVMAHPDDESIFCAGLLQKERRWPWLVICATDANADELGKARMAQWRQALRRLKVNQGIEWNLPDIYEKRLPIDWMVKFLSDLPTPQAVYTHSIVGEYGHPHHQDVSMAVHHAFHKKAPVWSVAYNCYPEKVIKISPAEYKVKTKILSEIYLEETRRFSHFLPAHAQEGFAKLNYKEVVSLYGFLSRGEEFPLKDLHHYKWYWSYLQALRSRTLPRPF